MRIIERQNERGGVPLYEILARLLQYALLEIGPIAEELLVRCGSCMVRVLDRCELHGADVVRRLRQPVLGGVRRTVDDRILRQRILDRAVKRFRDGVLSIVVVNLDRSYACSSARLSNRKSTISLRIDPASLSSEANCLVAYAKVWYFTGMWRKKTRNEPSIILRVLRSSPEYRSSPFMSGGAWKGMSGSPFAQRALSYNLS